MAGCLPRGVWYEADRDRYRVRLYRNKIPYLVGYYKTQADAEAALAGLRSKIQTIRKHRHNAAQRVPCSTFRDVAGSVHEDRERDPREYRRH